MQVVVNGGLREPGAILSALDELDGIMLGREAYHRPLVLAQLDTLVFGAGAISGNGYPTPAALDAATRKRAIERMQRYAERQLLRGERLSAVVRHMQGLYAGDPGASEFRRTLSEGAQRPGAGPQLLVEAAARAQSL